MLQKCPNANNVNLGVTTTKKVIRKQIVKFVKKAVIYRKRVKTSVKNVQQEGKDSLIQDQDQEIQ